MRVAVAVLCFGAAFLGVGSLSSIVLAQDMPPHAHKLPYGSSWGCDAGFRRNGNQCVAVVIPQNGRLNILGNDWDCNRGFRKTGQECVAVQVPSNADLNALGNGWACKRGFYRSGEGCAAVVFPDHAQLNVIGNGWVCVRGYRRAENKCELVLIPENAELNIFGNSWQCKYGFKPVGNACQKMSETELAAYKQKQEALRAYMRRRARCGGSYTTPRGAEFSVCVTDAHLDCREGLGSYDSCDVEVRFSLETNYNGDKDPDVEVGCEVEVVYSDKDGFSNTKSEDETKSVTMFSQNESSEIDLDISFFLEEPVRVRLSEARCRIKDVN